MPQWDPPADRDLPRVPRHRDIPAGMDPVQQAVGSCRHPSPSGMLLLRRGQNGSRSRRPHLATVFTHLFENALPRREGGEDRRHLPVRPEGGHHRRGRWRPASRRGEEGLFAQKAESYGHGLFLAHEILASPGSRSARPERSGPGRVRDPGAVRGV